MFNLSLGETSAALVTSIMPRSSDSGRSSSSNSGEDQQHGEEDFLDPDECFVVAPAPSCLSRRIQPVSRLSVPLNDDQDIEERGGRMGFAQKTRGVIRKEGKGSAIPSSFQHKMKLKQQHRIKAALKEQEQRKESRQRAKEAQEEQSNSRLMVSGDEVGNSVIVAGVDDSECALLAPALVPRAFAESDASQRQEASPPPSVVAKAGSVKHVTLPMATTPPPMPTATSTLSAFLLTEQQQPVATTTSAATTLASFLPALRPHRASAVTMMMVGTEPQEQEQEQEDEERREDIIEEYKRRKSQQQQQSLLQSQNPSNKDADSVISTDDVRSRPSPFKLPMEFSSDDLGLVRRQSRQQFSPFFDTSPQSPTASSGPVRPGDRIARKQFRGVGIFESHRRPFRDVLAERVRQVTDRLAKVPNPFEELEEDWENEDEDDEDSAEDKKQRGGATERDDEMTAVTDAFVDRSVDVPRATASTPTPHVDYQQRHHQPRHSQHHCRRETVVARASGTYRRHDSKTGYYSASASGMYTSSAVDIIKDNLAKITTVRDDPLSLVAEIYVRISREYRNEVLAEQEKELARKDRLLIKLSDIMNFREFVTVYRLFKSYSGGHNHHHSAGVLRLNKMPRQGWNFCGRILDGLKAHKLDRDGSGTLELPEIFRFLYPAMPLKDITKVVPVYQRRFIKSIHKPDVLTCDRLSIQQLNEYAQIFHKQDAGTLGWINMAQFKAMISGDAAELLPTWRLEMFFGRTARRVVWSPEPLMDFESFITSVHVFPYHQRIKEIDDRKFASPIQQQRQQQQQNGDVFAASASSFQGGCNEESISVEATPQLSVLRPPAEVANGKFSLF